MAQVRSLEEMEKIVNRNRSLYWDGWVVVNSYPSDKGRTSKFGAYVRGVWHLQKRFVPNKNGWDIPDRFVGTHGSKTLDR